MEGQFACTTYFSCMMTQAGNQVIVRMYTHAITTAAKVPKVDICGMSERLVRIKALPVVKDVTDIAFIARDQLHWNRASIDRLAFGWARDCFQASQKTKMSSAPIPKTMNMTIICMKV